MKLRRDKEGIIARKIIHYLSALIPTTYIFLEKSLIIKLLIVGSIIVVFSDILRMTSPKGKKLYFKLFGWMTKKQELKQEFTGASYLLIGSLITVLIFEKNIAILALIFLTIGDPTACLVGQFFGKIKTFQKKTLEGTIGLITIGFLVSLLITKIPVFYKILAAITAGIVEMLPIKINDNITVPLTTGFVLTLLTRTINIF